MPIGSMDKRVDIMVLKGMDNHFSKNVKVYCVSQLSITVAKCLIESTFKAAKVILFHSFCP
jgi:hypothetical protein